MWVMTIGALNQTLVNAVVERHLKFRSLIEVAPVTKVRLGFHQEEFLRLRVMWRMAGNTTHIVLGMYRVDRIHVLRPAGMAGHAVRNDFFGGNVLERKNLRNIAAPGNVRRPW